MSPASPRPPASLDYLEPAARALGQLPPDELNEDADTDPIVEVLNRRIGALPAREADRVLRADRATLEAWLEGQTDDEAVAAYHFIRGFLIYANAKDLRSTDVAEPPDRIIRADLPPPLQPQERDGAVDVEHEGVSIVLEPLGWLDYQIFRFQLRPRAKDILPHVVAEQTSDDVVFGPVKGRKYLYRQTEPVFLKRVDYLLRVPGGYAVVTVDGGGQDFDETMTEAFLHTLRVERPGRG